jgi:serine/threonine protein kinase
MLRGGALLGSGTYGCIFTPPLACKDGAEQGRKGRLGKITEPLDFLIEATAAKVLGPLGLPYFVLVDPGSPCIPSTEQKEKDLKLCKMIKEKADLEKVVQFTMPYAGKTLYNRIVDYDLLRGRMRFFDIMLQLLEAGAHLVAASYSHYDISVNNVVINEQGQVSLIDFGQSFSSKLITPEVLELRRKVFDPISISEPPEITLSQAPQPGVANIENVIERKEIFAQAERLLGLKRLQQAAELREFWTHSRAVEAKDWVAMWKLYWPTFDSWAVGSCLLLTLLPLLYKREFTESPMWKRYGATVKSILRGLLQANPRKRLDCVEALKLYDPDNAWFELHGTSWIEERERQRSAS